jgi:hypothetical protein
MLADILCTDDHRFRPLITVSDEIKALRALVRGRDDLVPSFACSLAQRVALAHQLRSLLEGFWPGATAIFAVIDTLRWLFHVLRTRNRGPLRPIALAFIGRYPTPDSASRLGEKRASPASWSSTLTAGAVRPRTCWPACARLPPVSPVTPKPRPGARSSACWLASLNASSLRSPRCLRASNRPSPPLYVAACSAGDNISLKQQGKR